MPTMSIVRRRKREVIWTCACEQGQLRQHFKQCDNSLTVEPKKNNKKQETRKQENKKTVRTKLRARSCSYRYMEGQGGGGVNRLNKKPGCYNYRYSTKKQQQFCFWGGAHRFDLYLMYKYYRYKVLVWWCYSVRASVTNQSNNVGANRFLGEMLLLTVHEWL